MKLIEKNSKIDISDFRESNVKIAESQEEYMTLPALKFIDSEGRERTVFQWKQDLEFELKMSLWSRIKFLITGNLKLSYDNRIWHTCLTFGQPLQPQLLSSEKPFEFKEEI